ncbi:MAG TPA: hypothetical protein VGE07_19390 [Herpetosiphonaceae bacterium]
MERIAIIGNAGGGKTTLARALSRRHGLPLHIVDLAQWRPGWVATPPDELAAEHAGWLAEPRWIIDGFGGLELIAARFAAADTLIFVDFPLPIHYWWAMKRQAATLLRPRDDLPPDCPMLPMTWRLLKVMWWVHLELRPPIIGLLMAARRRGARVIHVRRPAQLAELAG